MTSITLNSSNVNTGSASGKFDLAVVLEQLKAFLVPDTQAARKTVAIPAAKAPAARRWNAVSVECESFMNFTRG
jgi:hypothetical protein